MILAGHGATSAAANGATTAQNTCTENTISQVDLNKGAFYLSAPTPGVAGQGGMGGPLPGDSGSGAFYTNGDFIGIASGGAASSTAGVYTTQTSCQTVAFYASSGQCP